MIHPLNVQRTRTLPTTVAWHKVEIIYKTNAVCLKFIVETVVSAFFLFQSALKLIVGNSSVI